MFSTEPQWSGQLSNRKQQGHFTSSSALFTQLLLFHIFQPEREWKDVDWLRLERNSSMSIENLCKLSKRIESLSSKILFTPSIQNRARNLMNECT